MTRRFTRFASKLTAITLCASSTGALAATTQAVSPLVALSALGSRASRTALCGPGVATTLAGSGRSSTENFRLTACVRPGMRPALTPVAETSPRREFEVSSSPTPHKSFPNALSFGFPAVLAALALISLLTNSDDDLRVPIGPY